MWWGVELSVSHWKIYTALLFSCSPLCLMAYFKMNLQNLLFGNFRALNWYHQWEIRHQHTTVIHNIMCNTMCKKVENLLNVLPGSLSLSLQGRIGLQMRCWLWSPSSSQLFFLPASFCPATASRGMCQNDFQSVKSECLCASADFAKSTF